MAAIEDLDIDRVASVWVRFYAFLAQDVRTAMRAYEIVRALEKRLAAGMKLAAAIKAEKRLGCLSKADLKTARAAVAEDWTRLREGQADLLGPRLIKSLDDLLAEIRSSAPESATSSFEAGEEIRPRFRTVSPIFISHATLETTGDAKRLADALELRGLSCWFAPRNIPEGARWSEELRTAAESCGDMVLLLSRAALGSPYIFAEVDVAISAGKRVFVFHTEPGLDARDINIALNNWQHFNWFEGPDAAIEALIRLLGAERN
ncbi:MAG: toll/interleukin-1 receptor domain-containing protein [Terricaulis sp.]